MKFKLNNYKSIMTKIDKLLEEMCPNGVEYKELKDLSTVSAAGVD